MPRWVKLFAVVAVIVVAIVVVMVVIGGHRPGRHADIGQAPSAKSGP